MYITDTIKKSCYNLYTESNIIILFDYLIKILKNFGN